MSSTGFRRSNSTSSGRTVLYVEEGHSCQCSLISFVRTVGAGVEAGERDTAMTHETVSPAPIACVGSENVLCCFRIDFKGLEAAGMGIGVGETKLCMTCTGDGWYADDARRGRGLKISGLGVNALR